MFPNYKMFWGLRREQKQNKYCVIRLNPKLIWEKKCLFFFENAASSASTSVSAENMQTLSAFKDMFYEPSEGDKRQKRELHDYEPTDPQAEIQCLDAIESAYLLEVDFRPDDEAEIQPFLDNLKKRHDFNHSFNEQFFLYRHDCSYWKKIDSALTEADLI